MSTNFQRVPNKIQSRGGNGLEDYLISSIYVTDLMIDDLLDEKPKSIRRWLDIRHRIKLLQYHKQLLEHDYEEMFH